MVVSDFRRNFASQKGGRAEARGLRGHSRLQDGALAHLARAFDWQSRGDQFESGMLHPVYSES